VAEVTRFCTQVFLYQDDALPTYLRPGRELQTFQAVTKGTHV